MLQSSAILLLTYALIAILLYHRFVIGKRSKRTKDVAILACFVLLGIVIFALEGLPAFIILQLTLGVLIFNGTLISYGSRITIIYILLGILFIAASIGLGYRLIAQAMLIGALDEVAMMKSLKESFGNDKKVETNRDILQLCAGAFFILLFYFVNQQTSGTVLILSIFAGIILINCARLYKRNWISRIIYSLERRNTALGHGALWLAMGSLVAASFLNAPSIIIIFAAMFIGDSVATIVGVSTDTPRLPYNKKKSIGGSAAYFLSTALIAYPVVGPISFLVGFVAAGIESIPWKLDDNFVVSFIITAAILVGKML